MGCGVVHSAVALASLAVVSLTAGAAGQVQQLSIDVGGNALTRVDAYVTPWMNDGRPLTLFVALHGFGSSADDFASVGRDLAAMGVVAVLPQAPHGFDIGDGAQGYSWTLRNAGDAALRDSSRLTIVDEVVPALVRQMTTTFEVEATYLLGFSQGGRMALLTGLRHPELFDGIVTFGLSGFDADWIPALESGAPSRPPVWMGHGNAESAGVTAANRDTAARLLAAGYRVSAHTFDGGHEIPLASLRDAVIWMLRQRRP